MNYSNLWQFSAISAIAVTRTLINDESHLYSMGSISYNSAKEKELLHYIIHKCGHLENVGKTVLFKLLYFSDFDNYELHEKSITGETYVKLPMGPAPRHFDALITELKKENKIQQIVVDFKGKEQQKFLCIQQPELNHLSAEELQVVDRTIRKLSAMTATQISSYSHGDMPWKSANENEELDYEMVFYRDDTYMVREYDNDPVQ